MRRACSILAVSVLLVLPVAVGAAPASAAGETNIDYVEVAADGKISLVLSADGLPGGSTPDLDGITVTVNDAPVEAQVGLLEGGEVQRTAVLALDASLSMKGERFAAARSAADAFLAAAPDDVEIGLLTFAGSVEQVAEPTTDRAELRTAISNIDLAYGTRLHDAIERGVSTAGDSGARSILLLSDGKDVGSEVSLAEAKESALEAGVVVDVVAIDQSEAELAELALVARETGGALIDAGNSDGLEAVFAAQANALASQILITFPRPVDAGAEASIAVTLPAGGIDYTDSAFVALTSNQTETGPLAVDARQPLVGGLGLLIGAFALAVGLAGLLAIVLLGAKPASTIEKQMSYYSATGSRAGGKTPASSPEAAPSMRETAVAAAQKVVKGDFETRLAQRLNGAGVSMTAAEWLLLHSGIAVAAAFVGMVLRGPAFMVILFIAGLVLPWLFLKIKHSKRLAAFNSQLAETLTLLAGGLSAGLSLPQAVDTVVREGNEPMSGELRRALAEQRLGVDIEDALDGVADRMQSEDFSWVVMAIRIQREVGGNLAELLNTVSVTLRERDYLRRQVKVLSAEGRMSAWVLGGLPIAMFVYMLLVRPDVIRVLYTDPMGIMMSIAAVVLLAAGFFVMSKLVKVEV